MLKMATWPISIFIVGRISQSVQFKKKLLKRQLSHILDEFPSKISNLPYIFIDNLFTSFNVLQNLKDSGYNATGTIRENMIPRRCPLLSNKTVKRKKRGTCEFTIKHTDGIFICKWVVISVVSVAFTKYGHEPANPIKRYSRAEKKNIVVP